MSQKSTCYEGLAEDGWTHSVEIIVVTKRSIEEWGPSCVAVVVSAAWFFYDGTIPYYFAKELLSAIISAAAVGAGFLTTALSILMTLGSTPIGRQLKRRGKLGLLYSYLRAAIFSCLLAVVVCVVAFFFLTEGIGIDTYMSTAVVGASTLCMGCMLRIVEILIRVFVAMSEPEESSE